MTYALSAAAALVLAAWLVALPGVTRSLLLRWRLQRANFRGETVPTAYGVLILLWTLPALAAVALLSPERRETSLAWLVVVAAMGLLGLADDRWGDRRVKGLRGHVGALMRQRRVTTGLLKAVGGLAAACAGAAVLEAPDWWATATAAGVIALCANAWNLLDLRPGRAGAAFLLPAAALLSAQVADDALPRLALVAIPAAVAYPPDARARVMLGDTGANVLGAAMGLGLLTTLQGMPERLVVLGLLAALHVAAERWSLSAFVDAHPTLAKLDRLTGKR